MSGAFAGNAAIKADLRDRLNRHAAAGTLRFGATAWDGQGGSPLGVSTEGGDAADYATRFGYPLPLAGLLDPVMAYADPEQAVPLALEWVDCVAVGTDLSPVPERIALHFLKAMGADRLASRFYTELQMRYAAEAGAVPLPRQAWAGLREAIAQAAEAEAPRGDARAALDACATACWPLATSSSVLTTLIAMWLRDVNRTPDPEFGEADRASARTMLDAIYNETAVQRDAGEPVDIPALFRARDPALAAGFEAQLARANARYLQRARAVPDIVLAHLAAASSVLDRRVRIMS